VGLRVVLGEGAQLLLRAGVVEESFVFCGLT